MKKTTKKKTASKKTASKKVAAKKKVEKRKGLHPMSNVLNAKETQVYLALRSSTQPTMKISEIAAAAFTKKGSSPKTKGNSWVRNSLRKIVRLKLAKKATDGCYKWTGADALAVTEKPRRTKIDEAGSDEVAV